MNYVDEYDQLYCENCKTFYGEKIKKKSSRSSGLVTKVLVLLVVGLLVTAGIYYFVYDGGGEEDEDDEITIQDASDIRGLEVLREVNYTYMTREELKDHMDSTQDRNMTALTQSAFESLFLVEPGEDVMENMSGSYSEQVLGFYEPENNRMVIIEGSSSLLNRITMIHELTHALQDQHFDLTSLVNVETTDQMLSRRAVYEGDATIVQYDYMRTLTEEEMSELKDEITVGAGNSTMPFVLEKMMTFPYRKGFNFVYDFYGGDDWDAVNALYSDPPESTEQVLHPEKYRAGEEPVNVTMDITVKGMDLGVRDRLGEYMLYLMFHHYVNRTISYEAAEGWGGDLFHYYSNSTDHLSVYKIRWDSNEDAVEFSQTYDTWVDHLPDEYSNDVQEGRFNMESENRTTYIYHSTSSDLVDDVMNRTDI